MKKMYFKIIFSLLFVLSVFFVYSQSNAFAQTPECGPGLAACLGSQRCSGGVCHDICDFYDCGYHQGIYCGSCGSGNYCWTGGTCHNTPQPTATPQPTDTPVPTTRPNNSPTPTPYIRIIVRDKAGAGVLVSRICRAVCEPLYASCTQSQCVSNQNRQNFLKTTGAKLGGKIKLETDEGAPLVLLGVTPSAGGTMRNPCPDITGACYTWSSTSWTTGMQRAIFIVASVTPVPPTVTLTPTVTPSRAPSATPTVVPPTATPVPGCLCKSDNTCDPVCAFDKYSDVTYTSPVRCSRETSIAGPTPASSQKTLFCQRNKRTKGDVDGDGVVTLDRDYFYYVAAVNGGGVPSGVDADANGDGVVSPSDRAIIIRSLPQ